jgi:proteic killer suppression protein
MIVSFRHKGLRRLYDTDNASGVRADQADRLRRVLAVLDRIKTPEEADLPGYRLHALKGELRGFWSITVSGNWRVIFRMTDGQPSDVDLVDYH